jgi:hypothetical protein
VTLANRVLPTGQIVAIPDRGTLTGNRGILHGPDKVLVRQHQHTHWITCRLDWKGVRRPVMTGRKWTELFFLDEATACAAGHRPCAYCRRAEYAAFLAVWTTVHGAARAHDIDRTLHAARRDGRDQRRHRAPVAGLPDGAMILHDGPALILDGALRPWTPAGYGPPSPLPSGDATVLTPAPLVAVMAAGWRPLLHATATGTIPRK